MGGLFRSSLGLMKRGKDHGQRKRKPASASEAASRSTMNDRAKSAKKQQQADDAAAARSRMQAALSRGSMQSSHGAAASSDNVDGGQSAADDAAPGSDSALTGLQDPDAARASGASTAVARRGRALFRPAGACGSLGTASPRATPPDTAAWPPAFSPASYRPPPALLVPQLDADMPTARRL